MIPIEHLAEIHDQCFKTTRPWAADEFRALLENPHCFLVGTGQCFAVGRVIVDQGEILTLATAPQNRRQGNASSVLAAFHIEAVKRGAKTIFLEVAKDNLAAVALYQSCGYEITATRKNYYRQAGFDPIDALIMTRKFQQNP